MKPKSFWIWFGPQDILLRNRRVGKFQQIEHSHTSMAVWNGSSDIAHIIWKEKKYFVQSSSACLFMQLQTGNVFVLALGCCSPYKRFHQGSTRELSRFKYRYWTIKLTEAWNFNSLKLAWEKILFFSLKNFGVYREKYKLPCLKIRQIWVFFAIFCPI